MDAVIQSLLDLGDATLHEIKIAKTDVVVLVDHELHKLSKHPKFKSTRIHKKHPERLVVETDQDLLSILVYSLLNNALTFQKADAPEITIRISYADNQLSIEVSDRGEGIAEEIKPHIFEMFYRGSELSTGPGMGLYVVSKIIKRLKGRLEWQSKPGATTFQVVIPLSTPPVS